MGITAQNQQTLPVANIEHACSSVSYAHYMCMCVMFYNSQLPVFIQSSEDVFYREELPILVISSEPPASVSMINLGMGVGR